MQIVYTLWYTSSKNKKTSIEYSQTWEAFFSKSKNDHNAQFLLDAFTHKTQLVFG